MDCSASTQKLVDIIKALFRLAIDVKDELEAANYLQAAIVIVDTFLLSTPRLHQQALFSVPSSGGESLCRTKCMLCVFSCLLQ